MSIFFIPFALGPIKKVTVPGNAIPLLTFTATVGTPERGAGFPWLLFFETDHLPRELNNLVMKSFTDGANRIIPAATTIFYDESGKGASK